MLREEIKEAGLDRAIWQYFAVLPNIRSVGVRDDERSYDYTIGIRAVHSVDGMTSEWAQIPWEVLDKISKQIVNDVEQVNRVVYDITSKPPATIEWEKITVYILVYIIVHVLGTINIYFVQNLS